MPTIPTPFIGGADSPQRDSAKKKSFAPPYHPGSVEPDEATIPDVDPADAPWEFEAEDEEAGFERVPVEMEAEASDGLTEPEPEPEEAPAAPAEAFEPTEVEPAEPVLAEFKTVAIGSPPALQPAVEEGVLDEEAFEPIGPLSDEAEAAVDAERVDEGEGHDLPSFLLGPDATAAEEPPGRDEFERALDEEAIELGQTEQSAEQLAELGRDLLAGEEGERIRALIDDLRSLTADIAVPRAFAAGYLAAKKREEN